MFQTIQILPPQELKELEEVGEMKTFNGIPYVVVTLP